MTTSEVTIKEVWPHLCESGICELRINDRTVWSDSALDVLADKEYYDKACDDYLKCTEEELLGDRWKNFRVTHIDIKIVDFHHCVADVKGYFEDVEGARNLRCRKMENI